MALIFRRHHHRRWLRELCLEFSVMTAQTGETTFRGLSVTKITDCSEYILWSQMTEIKYNLCYDSCKGRRFTAAAQHITSCSEVKLKS